MKNISTMLQEAVRSLTLHSDTPYLDASLLLAEVLNMDRLSLLVSQAKQLSSKEMTRFKQIIKLRAKGMPVAYLTGKKAFWSLDLKVNLDTLIPRPETEILVEAALGLFSNRDEIVVADLGTGSGAIALALALERPAWKITGVDISQAALEIASQNALAHGIQNVLFKKSNWFGKLKAERFDLIVSNPPYLSEKDPHLNTDIRYEPRDALVSGKSGLESITRLILQSKKHLNAGGWLILEHGYEQGPRVRDIFESQDYSNIYSLEDLSNQERVSLAQIS